MTHSHRQSLHSPNVSYNNPHLPGFQGLETSVRRQFANLQQANSIEDLKESVKRPKSQVGGLMTKEDKVANGDTAVNGKSPKEMNVKEKSPKVIPPPPSKCMFQRYKTFATALMILVVFTLYAAQRYYPYEIDYIHTYFQANPKKKADIIGVENFNKLLISLKEKALQAFPKKMNNDFRSYVLSFISQKWADEYNKRNQPLTWLERMRANSKQLIESFVKFITVARKAGVTSSKDMVSLSSRLSSFVIKPTLKASDYISRNLPFRRYVTTENIKKTGGLILKKIADGVLQASKTLVNTTWNTLSLFETSLSSIMDLLDIEVPRKTKYVPNTECVDHFRKLIHDRRDDGEHDMLVKDFYRKNHRLEYLKRYEGYKEYKGWVYPPDKVPRNYNS